MMFPLSWCCYFISFLLWVIRKLNPCALVFAVALSIIFVSDKVSPVFFISLNHQLFNHIKLSGGRGLTHRTEFSRCYYPYLYQFVSFFSLHILASMKPPPPLLIFASTHRCRIWIDTHIKGQHKFGVL